MFQNQCRIAISAMVIGLATVPTIAQFPAELLLDDLDGRNGFTVTGYVYGEFGLSVDGLGDVNADGIDDIGTGSFGVWFTPNCHIPGCEPTAGATYVIFGSPDIGGDGLWSAREVDGTNGFRIPGIVVGESAGKISSAGDFDGDGIADFMVGVPFASPNGTAFAGEARLIYGRPGLGANGEFDVSSLDGSNGFVVQGSDGLGKLGGWMGHVGDFNGDGVSDIILSSQVGDPGGRHNAGEVYVLYGGQGTGQNGPFRVPNDMTPQNGLVINGAEADDQAGGRVGSAGDFNGDGYDDVVFGSSELTQPLARGTGYVVYGGPDVSPSGMFELSDLNGSNGFAINGPASPFGSDTWIFGLVGVGDINDDGYDDVAISVKGPSNGSGTWIGVVFGGADVAPDGVLCLEDVDIPDGFRVVREDGIASSTAVAAGGDVNNDQIDDMFAIAGWPVLVFGGPDVGGDGVIETASYDGIDLFRAPIGGRDRSFAGDVNNDGIDDVIAGWSYESDLDIGTDIGAITVVFGRRMGDGDLDADVDFADFGGFQVCFGVPADGDVPDECHPFDFDLDNDVDLEDYAAFEEAFGTEP